jgi:hypothetical protein
LWKTSPVTVASCERSFSKLKIIKNYLRLSIAQDRLSNLRILSIEYEIVKTINLHDVINEFSSVKARHFSL